MVDAIGTTVLEHVDAGHVKQFLVDRGDITEMDWRVAEEVGQQNDHTALQSLLNLGLLGEDVLADRLAECSGQARWKPGEAGEAGEPGEAGKPGGAVMRISNLLPRRFMQANGLLLLESIDEATDGDAAAMIWFVCTDPTDHRLIVSVLNRVDCSVAMLFGTHKQIEQFLSEQEDHALDDAAVVADDHLDVSTEIDQLRDMASEAPVIRLFNQTVDRAMELGASDIHLEKFDHRVSLRLRVDGILIDQPPPAARMYDALLCRIKIMAELDIAERRLAQDGRIRMRLSGRIVDLRVSLVPTIYGQHVVLRLQDAQRLNDVTLKDLGFSQQHIQQLTAAVSKSHGIVLVTGPTGSGKTTTLYALLKTLVNVERKIITVEDPVEYMMDGVNQIQVNPTIDLTFSNSLRHMLRHDPDVILIGEIRDPETAQMAFQAALTGHMILSTLHTNDVPSTFARLMDLGVDPYLINSSIEYVSAQRLLRRLCKDCQGKAADCPTCGNTGYRGRIAVTEASSVTPDIKTALARQAGEQELRQLLINDGYQPLQAHAKQLVDEGVTDEKELIRVFGLGVSG